MKKELFYIRGNAERADEVKAALLEKYPDAENPNDHSFNCEEVLYYVDPVSNCIATTIKGVGGACGILVYFGTELHLPPKEEPKFKVGDVVLNRACLTYYIVSDTKDDDLHILSSTIYGGLYSVRLATPEEIDKWNEKTLHPKSLHYSQSDRKLKHRFLPFDKVLVKDGPGSNWKCNFFSHYEKEGTPYPYCTVYGYHKYCIPYNEKTANLLGTKDDYEEEEL